MRNIARFSFLTLTMPTVILFGQANVIPGNPVVIQGNVGIGTMNPGQTLDVSGPGYLQAQFGSTTIGNAGGLALRGYDGNSYQQFEFQSIPSNANPAGSLIIYDRTHGLYDLTINSSGNVGIGTTNPGQTLDVNGPGYLQAQFDSTTSGNAGGLESLPFSIR